MIEYKKYDWLVEADSAVWWNLAGPLGGLHALNAVRTEYFKDKLGRLAGKRVLDVGCGGGILAESLAREGASVVGVDPSEKSIETARRHAAEQGLQIDYRHGFAENLPADEPFDVVFAVDVLEHVEDLGRALDNCARLLKPGGVFGFLTHNQTLEAFTELIWKGEYVFGLIPKGNHDFHKFIAPTTLTTLLSERSLSVRDITGLELDWDKPEIRFAATPQISYLGYAVKEG
jgi:2-polyprenyl-6-hydroxyphenyl methylase/3-demethylubiquinone-9 3-methyltransferase